MKSKEPVKLRTKKIKNGNTSLYLDIYINGKRQYEFLKLYLVPEVTRADRTKNRETMQLAEAIKAKRIVEIRNDEFGFKNSKSATMFFPYFEKMIEKRNDGDTSTSENWQTALTHIQAFEKNKGITFEDIDRKWVEKFVRFLENDAKPHHSTPNGKLSEGSKVSYFSKLRTCLAQAVRDGILDKNPAEGMMSFRQPDTERMYLTIDEVRLLVKTECRREEIKNIFLFSCLTGLRKSDIAELKWGDVQQQGNFTRIIFRQKKTQGQEYLDITPQAVQYMGERGKDSDKVFPKMYTTTYINMCVDDWIKRAGINKHISFHCARHTFAVMMLDIGTDIYTVSKLLGHRELSTTQIYAKVLDKNKQKAVLNIPNID